MAKTDPNKPICSLCKKRNAQHIYKGLCTTCYKNTRPIKVARATSQLGDVAMLLQSAKTEEDWKKLAKQLEPTILGIADGSIKASAAQAAVVKEIMSRAYGRVTKSQEENQGPIGIVILPTIGTEREMQICPRCQEFHFTHG